MKLEALRKKYPKFVYQNYSYCFKKGDLKISFYFKIDPDIRFKPEIIVKNCRNSNIKQLESLIFHLGMMEIPSYWKAACSPEIIIKAGYLDKEQISWWRDLIIKGMGQFFYENKINFKSPNFLTIKSESKIVSGPFKGKLKGRFLAPFSGGKDSIVTLEKLKEQNKPINAFAVNPSSAAKEVLKIAGIEKPIVVERKIDKKLLALNAEGYLNGHTPFTAVLSFLSVFCAVLFDYKNIAFSNEKSADEGNVTYLGKTINHQWAKSSEFEKMFKIYCQKYLAKNINYFSFLRKYAELQIAEMFSKYPKYFSAFSSCNRGLKIGAKWCNNCPKCLFTYLMLSPYLPEEQLLKIFGKNLLKDKKLKPLLRQLTGEKGIKPFECVGTYKESKLALKLNADKRIKK